MDGIRRPPRIPRVDRNTRPKPTITITPRKLAQNQRPEAPLLALHKLVRAQRHALAQARHNERVPDRQQREVLTERQVLRVQEHDGLVRQRRVARVDARDDVGDAPRRGLVRLRRLQRHLDEHDLALPLRVLVEEALECGELVLDALDLVELVSPDEDFHSGVALLQDLHPFNDFGILSVNNASR